MGFAESKSELNMKNCEINKIKIKSEKNERISSTKIQAQCYRQYMEDSSIIKINFEKNSSLFGVFDGHGGSLISNFVAQNIGNAILNNISFQKGKIEESLKETFLKFDVLLKNPKIDNFICECNLNKNDSSHSNQSNSTIDSENNDNNNCNEGNFFNENIKNKKEKKNLSDYISYNMGTTANIILIKNNYIYIANVGDCLSYMYYNKKAIKLNNQHNVNLEEEKNRILKSGNKIINGRINGRLNLTRAIGDFSFKNNSKLNYYEQAVISLPEINKFEINNNIDFIIMGSDGFWNYVNPDKLCYKIYSLFQKGFSTEDVSKNIFKILYKQLLNMNPQETDNLTFIIIKFE